MLSTRIHEYQEPLVIDRIPRPKVTHGEKVLIRVGAAGLCHSDLHLTNREWKDVLHLKLPKTPGHEVAGRIEELRESVPVSALMKKGDLVAILVDGDVVFANTAKMMMSSFVTFQDYQDYLLMTEVILNML